MLMYSYSIMNVESTREFMDNLYSEDKEKCYAALIRLKNIIIGSNRQKSLAIAQGIVPQLVDLFMDQHQPLEIRNECVIVLGSLAKGGEQQLKQLLKTDVVTPLLNSVFVGNDSKLTENCLRCLCTIFKKDCASSAIFENRAVVSHMLKLIMHSISNQISITTILASSIKTKEHQNMIWDEGTVFSLAALLNSPHSCVLMPTLACLASLCYENGPVSLSVSTACFGQNTVPDLLKSLISRDKPTEMQLASAKCLTYLHRANALSVDDPRIKYKTLPVLVYLCQEIYDWKIRTEAAETLAYLTEVNVDLQRIAAISNQLITVLNSYLTFSGDKKATPTQNKEIKKEMAQAAFRVFASLGANDEDIRKRIIESDKLVDNIMTSLDDSNTKVKLAAIRCLHSLSRSVQQLRTTFQDHSVWKPLMKLLEDSSEDVLIVTSSTLCNLLLEFSPSKEPMVDAGALTLLCNLTKSDNCALRLNGIWALMNMAFQSEKKIKLTILSTLGIEQIEKLFQDSDVNVLMKTLGLLRNLLSTTADIDIIMDLHGDDIIKMVTSILNGNHPVEVTEQALCTLANIGDGDIAKDFIMSNEELLKQLLDFMMNPCDKLQIAAIFCISNLVWREAKGSYARQAKFKDLGIGKLLQQLIITKNTLLFDKVKTAMTQFSE